MQKIIYKLIVNELFNKNKIYYLFNFLTFNIFIQKYIDIAIMRIILDNAKTVASVAYVNDILLKLYNKSIIKFNINNFIYKLYIIIKNIKIKYNIPELELIKMIKNKNIQNVTKLGYYL